jgi:hypothetical protein
MHWTYQERNAKLREQQSQLCMPGLPQPAA